MKKEEEEDEEEEKKALKKLKNKKLSEALHILWLTPQSKFSLNVAPPGGY